jgi:hypothetical protein
MAVTKARKHEQVEKLSKELKNVSNAVVATSRARAPRSKKD